MEGGICPVFFHLDVFPTPCDQPSDSDLTVQLRLSPLSLLTSLNSSISLCIELWKLRIMCALKDRFKQQLLWFFKQVPSLVKLSSFKVKKEKAA